MIPLIFIDFIPGTHGNFLKYLLNNLLCKEDLSSPFTNVGTSHRYYTNLLVHSGHYGANGNEILLDNVISVRFNEEDLLKLTSLSFYRAGDFKIDDTELHVNTYNKLKNKDNYFSVIENLNNSYNLNLSESTPDCPKYILREFFKFGFKNPSNHGFILDLNKMNYELDKKVYSFYYSSFYEYEKLINELKNIERFFNLKFYPKDLKQIHDKFLSYLVKYIELKPQADSIIESVKNNEYVDIPNLTLLQESYINGILERDCGVEMPFYQEQYFANTKEIIDWINK